MDQSSLVTCDGRRHQGRHQQPRPQATWAGPHTPASTKSNENDCGGVLGVSSISAKKFYILPTSQKTRLPRKPTQGTLAS